MKKLIIVVLCIGSLLNSGCFNREKEDTSLAISFDMPNFGYKNREVAINLNLSHDNLDIILTSSNPSVAFIRDYKLYTVTPGVTEIKAQYKGTSYVNVMTYEVKDFNELSISASHDIERGGYVVLEVIGYDKDMNPNYYFESSDDMIASVDQRGYVFGHKIGHITITVHDLQTGKSARHHMEVVYPKPTEIVIHNLESTYDVHQEFSLVYTLLPVYTVGEIKVISSDEDIVSVDEQLTMHIKGKIGKVTLIFYVLEYPEILFKKEIEIMSQYNINDLVDRILNFDLLEKHMTVYGYQFNYQHHLLGSVIPYYFGNNQVIQHLIPVTHRNRLNIVAPIHYVVIHDTGSSASTAGELAHSQYVRNKNTGVSWHYTLGDVIIYQHLPDEEQGIHAGDGGRIYQEFDSGVPYVHPYPKVTIDAWGYYQLDKITSQIKAPMVGSRIAKTSDIIDSGIRVVKGQTGNYMIGQTYYSGLGKIANTGGDKNGIGIEMTIHQGSDLYQAYQKLAKHTATLLVTHRLTPHDVKQHNFFTGKNCPQTLRQNGLWNDFMDMVWFEYLMKRYFSDYTIEVISSDLNVIDQNGRFKGDMGGSNERSVTINFYQRKQITLSFDKVILK